MSKQDLAKLVYVLSRSLVDLTTVPVFLLDDTAAYSELCCSGPSKEPNIRPHQSSSDLSGNLDLLFRQYLESKSNTKKLHSASMLCRSGTDYQN